MTSVEKRESERFRVVDACVEYQTDAMGHRKTLENRKKGNLHNVSLRGAQILAKDEPPPTNELIRMDFTLSSSDEPVCASGTVQWAAYDSNLDMYRVGVRFSSPDDRNENLIRMIQDDADLPVLERRAVSR